MMKHVMMEMLFQEMGALMFVKLKMDIVVRLLTVFRSAQRMFVEME